MTTQLTNHSWLSLHAPGHEQALLGHITGESDFPEIGLGTLSGWRRAFLEGGYLRQYVERLRELYVTGVNSEGTYLACPLCPMSLCGVGLDTPEAIDASCVHALEHLSEYRRQQNAAVTLTAGV